MDDDPNQQVVHQILSHVPEGLGAIEMTIYVAVLLFLLVMSGLVSGSEVAFFSLSSKQIVEFASSEKGVDRKIATLLLDPKRLLASILITNNLLNVAIVTISTYFTWQLVGKVGFLATFIPTVIITILIVFFGEILPKVYANNNSISFARMTAGLLSFVHATFYLLAIPLLKFSQVIERRIGSRGYDISVDELNEAIEMTSDEETSQEEKDILRGIVNFSNIHVRQIMQARTEIFAIDCSDDFHEVMDKINKFKCSRIPVYKENIDQLEGILHVKDLLPYINSNEKFNWKILLRSVYYIPESKMIDDLLASFQEKRVHMAIVVDEYGGTSGLVTLEDVVEEIVGEINDEFDVEEVDFEKIDNSNYVFEGKTSLTDLSKILDLRHDTFDEVKGENESLGGLLLELNSTMPNVNEVIYFSKYEFKVLSVNSRRIKKVQVTLLNEHYTDKNLMDNED